MKITIWKKEAASSPKVCSDFHLDEMVCNLIRIQTVNFLNKSPQLHTCTIPTAVHMLPRKVLNLLLHEMPSYFIK